MNYAKSVGIIGVIVLLIIGGNYYLNTNKEGDGSENTPEVNNLEEVIGAGGDITTGEVKAGESVLINGVRITVNSILEDSRCPQNVQCVWAGRIRLSVTLKSDSDTETLEISSNEESYVFDSFAVSLVGATPEPIAGRENLKENYKFTFKVSSNLK